MNYKLLNDNDFKSWLSIRCREEVAFTKDQITKIRYIFDSINFTEVKNRSFRIKRLTLQQAQHVPRALHNTSAQSKKDKVFFYR